ncbi:MAG: hypothetical protein AAF907_18380, partial [Planctomycetota bacterium]
MSRSLLAVAALLGASAGLLAMTVAPPGNADQTRQQAAKLLKKGDYADALKLYEQLLADGDVPSAQAADDLTKALEAMGRLGRQELADGLRET